MDTGIAGARLDQMAYEPQALDRVTPESSGERRSFAVLQAFAGSS